MGYTQKSHTGVIKKYGELSFENKLPPSISYYLLGTKKEKIYGNITKPIGLSNISFNRRDSETIDNQICMLLNSTREFKLKELGEEYKKRNKIKRMNSVQLQEVSQNLGCTTLLDFLYRKRVKSNYQNTDTFTSELLDGHTIIDELCFIVDKINLVSECYTYKRLGRRRYNSIVEPQLKIEGNELLQSRFELVQSLNS